MKSIRIAQAQINLTVGDLEQNAKKIADSIKKSAQAGADLASVPELALAGYPPEDLLLKPAFIRDCGEKLEALAKEVKDITAIVGAPVMADGSLKNAAVVIRDGAIVDYYFKNELPNYGVFDERRYFTPGTEGLVITVNGVRLAVTICEDVWIEGSGAERTARDSSAAGVINLSASPFHAGKLRQRTRIFERFCRASGACLFYANLVGGQDELVFDGTSMALGPDGELFARARRFEEDLLITDLMVASYAHLAKYDPPGDHPFILISERTSGISRTIKTFPSLAPEMATEEEVYQALVVGVRDYVVKNGFDKVLIGLSGGIDSSLTAAVARDALGADKVVGVTMPSRYTSDGTFSDAGLLARNLGIKYIEVPIEPMVKAYGEGLSREFGKGPPGVEAENLQARVRGNILMALSNRFGWLVLTTGNKSEMAVGYATLYGDMAGGFAAIKDVPKTLVYGLSRLVNEKAGAEVIPLSVIERPPSAELRADQKDEDSLPPYDELDGILELYVEEDLAPRDIARKGFDLGRVLEVVRMVDRNEYKRRQAPPGVKITPKAFGKDRRLPITNRYRPK